MKPIMHTLSKISEFENQLRRFDAEAIHLGVKFFPRSRERLIRSIECYRRDPSASNETNVLKNIQKVQSSLEFSRSHLAFIAPYQSYSDEQLIEKAKSLGLDDCLPPCSTTRRFIGIHEMLQRPLRSHTPVKRRRALQVRKFSQRDLPELKKSLIVIIAQKELEIRLLAEIEKLKSILREIKETQSKAIDQVRSELESEMQQYQANRKMASEEYLKFLQQQLSQLR